MTLTHAAQAEYLKKDLTERMRQKVINAQSGGKPLQPRWFQLKSPSCLTPTVVSGIEQRYRYYASLRLLSSAGF